jgi:hypothetical protein
MLWFLTKRCALSDLSDTLVLLADRINWDGLAIKVAVYFSKEGRMRDPVSATGVRACHQLS